MISFDVFIEKNALSKKTIERYKHERGLQSFKSNVLDDIDPHHRQKINEGSYNAHIRLNGQSDWHGLSESQDIPRPPSRARQRKSTYKQKTTTVSPAMAALAIAGTAAAAYGAKKLYDRYKKNKQQEKDSAA